MNNYKLPILALLLGTLVNLSQGVIRCPLVWSSIGAGEKPPGDAVPVFSEAEDVRDATLFIARRPKLRRYDLLKSWPVGVYDTTTGCISVVSLLPFNFGLKVVESTVIEILTNPHGCTLEWVFGTRKPNLHPAPTGEHGRFIGRSVAPFGPGSKLISGYCVDDNNKVFVPSTDEDKLPLTGSILHSHYHGIDMQMREFRVVNSELFPANREFLGIDQIINNSPARIRQSVQHEASLKEETLMTSQTMSQYSVSFSASLDIEINIDVDVPGFLEFGGDDRRNKSVPISLNHSWKKEPVQVQGASSVSRTVKEANVGISREVWVEPYSSVQVCSTVTIQTYEMEYSSVSVYSVPGYSGREINELLYHKGNVVGNTVEVLEYGKFQGTRPVATNFFVMPLNDQIGCNSVV